MGARHNSVGRLEQPALTCLGRRRPTTDQIWLGPLCYHARGGGEDGSEELMSRTAKVKRA